MTNFKCQHPIKAVDDNNFCHECGKQLEVSTNSGTNYVEALLTQNAEQAATIARLTADAKLNDMAWTDNQAALKQITAAIEDIKYYVGNPSAWEHYDDGVSEKIRAILKAAGMA